MKYVSVDIETTGLDHDLCQIIEFTAVLADSAKPFQEVMLTFHRVLKEDFDTKP